jgi:hypothetical protein
MRNRALGLTCFCATAFLLAACAKGNNASGTENAATTPAATPAPEAAPAPAAAMSFADVAGKWNVRAVPETGDTTPTNYVLTATGDSSGWSIAFPNGLTVPAHPSVSGDSIVLHAGPYASVRRKGVQVTTDGVLRRQGDSLVGTTVAHYKTTKPDSVLRLNVQGSRAH